MAPLDGPQCSAVGVGRISVESLQPVGLVLAGFGRGLLHHPFAHGRGLKAMELALAAVAGELHDMDLIHVGAVSQEPDQGALLPAERPGRDTHSRSVRRSGQDVPVATHYDHASSVWMM